VVKESTGAQVDLENPDKVVVVEIFGDVAHLAVVSGGEFYKKMRPYKYPMYRVFRSFVVAHEPYLGPPDAAYTFGTRIGREVQTYEVGELVVAPIGQVDAHSLMHFLRGLFEGIESRFEVQRRSYGREVYKTKVTLQDMYQFVRSRMGEPLVIFEPEGEPASKIASELSDFIVSALKKGKRVNLMVGAREGVPTSLFRFANYVVDVAPGIVISTDYALASALIALATILHERLASEVREESV
jgi:tRNA acetyltransferase TAN1